MPVSVRYWTLNSTLPTAGMFLFILTFSLLFMQHSSAIGADLYDEFEDDITDNRNHKHLVAWNCDLKNSLEFSEFSLMKVETCANVSSQ